MYENLFIGDGTKGFLFLFFEKGEKKIEASGFGV